MRKKISVLLTALIIVSLLAGCADEMLPSESAAASESTTVIDTPETSTQSVEDIDTSAYYNRVVEEQDDALTPFVREALAQGIDADSLFSNYLNEMAIPDDSAAYQKSERSISENGVLIRTAILHEKPINASGLPADTSLDELVTAQFEFYEEYGSIDYSGSTDEPTYQIVGLAINGSYVKAEFRLTVNDMEIGTYTLDNNVLLLPLNIDGISADAPVEVRLTVLSGNLPTPDYIYVGIHSNISSGR